MTNQDFDTLAYTKSPKTSKRTTFQDELQDAVSARARKIKPKQFSYLDEFSDNDIDIFGGLPKSRKKRADAFKAGRSKGKINDFDLSDDEQKDAGTKRVSFRKSQRISSPLEDTVASELNENEPLNSSVDRHGDQKSLFSLQSSTNESEGKITCAESVVESSNTEDVADNPDECPSNLNSEDTELDLASTLPSDTCVMEPSGPLVCEGTEEKNTEESSHFLADSVTEREPPKPKPRQRAFRATLHPMEKQADDSDAQDLCKPLTSTAPVPLSSSSNNNRSEGDHRTLHTLRKSSSHMSEQSQLSVKSTADSGSRDGAISGDEKEQERTYSTSFEDLNEDSGKHSADRLTHVHEEAINTRTSGCSSKASQRSRSVCSNKTKSKYLGTLKILDSKLSLQESQPQNADLLRAAIYQEWVKKKKEMLRKNMQLKKEEEEKRKKEEEAKKEEAVLSFEAWKQKKAENLKAKAKEKQDLIRKEQMASQEREEKRQSAKQVFEKWKQEHDHLLKENIRKQREAENKLKLKTQQKDEERRGESKSAFSKWCEKKSDVLDTKTMREREEIKTKEEEERYQREEREALALEMYEKWLAKKSQQEKRQREERWMQEILQDSPHPPWNPPNKTIPFRK